MFFPVFYNWQKRDLQPLKPQQTMFFDDGVEFNPPGSGISVVFDVYYLLYPKKQFSGYWSIMEVEKLLVLYKCDPDGSFDLKSDHITVNKSVNGSYGQYGFFGLKPGSFSLDTINGVGKKVSHNFEFSLLYTNYLLEV